MQTLFQGEKIQLYRTDGDFYLKNGSTHKITQGQGNVLISKLNGLTDTEAESLITSEYEQGNIKIVEERDLVKECHNRVSVERNIYQKIYNGELRNAFLVRVKIKGVLSQGSFNSIVDARKFRDAVKGYAVSNYKSTEKKRLVEPSIIECTTLRGIRYMAKFALTRNGVKKFYGKRFETIEEAREYKKQNL